MGEWIWYPADFEIFLSGKVNSRRNERGMIVPPFWRMDSCYKLVTFKKEFTAGKGGDVFIEAEGVFNVTVNHKYIYGVKDKFTIDKGENLIEILVYNEYGLPALKLSGDVLETDESFFVTCQDRNPVKVGHNQQFLGDMSPNTFKLPTRKILPEKVLDINGSVVYDFGKELMAFVCLDITVGGILKIVYGESLEEAVDEKEAEVYDSFQVDKGVFVSDTSRAFRFLHIKGCEYDKNGVSVLYEYLPQKHKSSFVSGDELLNKIFDMSMYTLELTSREFFLDGIKRDRWTWGGDFYQCILMNPYAFRDNDIVRRTFRALFGKPPVVHHTNHIMDYSFLMIIGLYEYYKVSGDIEFVKEIYVRAKELMDFCIGRENKDGYMEGLENDWVFIDWAELDNKGVVCAEQMLYAAALREISKLAKFIDRSADNRKYYNKYLKAKTSLKVFWDEDKGCFIHSIKNGKSDGLVLKHANIFAVLFDLVENTKKQKIIKNVFKNDKIPQIITPYFKFYELSAMCKCGMSEDVLKQIKSCWGGMLKEGATSFWELYNPEEDSLAHYQMYNRKYGKSLCHAWGAAPVYLLGKYFSNSISN